MRTWRLRLKFEEDAVFRKSKAVTARPGDGFLRRERGEVRADGERGKAVPDPNSFSKPTAADIGISRKEIHEARIIDC